MSAGSERLRIAVLGSTGSIGRQTLEVAEQHNDRIEVVALAAGRNVARLVEQIERFRPRVVALGDAAAAWQLSGRTIGAPIGAGPDAVVDLALRDDVDLVLNALVGAAGLRATLAALDAGKTLALANKESLVAGGELVTEAAQPGQLVPVDSEHSAIMQCLVGEPAADVSRIWLTASGGPFRGRTRHELSAVTPEEALAHPTWNMGPKITIDSATLMNKGLEVIEAHHLFGLPYDRITVVVHPQSIVHSMVEYADGSVKAHLGTTDMRIPIQYALSRPRRWAAPVEPLDFRRLAELQFGEPDTTTFRALALAFEAGRAGGTLPAVMNAANERAVEAFLQGSARFTDIDITVEQVMERHRTEPLSDIDQVEEADRWARAEADRVLASVSTSRG